MGTVAEGRPHAQDNLISLQDALHVFWDWHLASVRVEVSFLGKGRPAETVRVSIDGMVSLVDPQGVVTISGDRREMKLHLQDCMFSRPRNAPGSLGTFHSLDPDSILQVTFPRGEVCLIFPYRRVAPSPGGRARVTSGLDWLRHKLTGSTARPPTTTNVPIGDLRMKAGPLPLSNRRLFVEVHGGLANIVEVLDGKSETRKVRRLKEQFLPQDKRAQADRLKRRIIFGENGGSYELKGLYRPQTAGSVRELTHLVGVLEDRDGPHAWDRRRYAR